MKKMIVCVAALLLGVVAAQARDDGFNGLYGGVQGSYATPHDSDIDGDGFSGTAFGGYGATSGKFYFGAEAFGGISGTEYENGGETVEGDLTYGGAARLGRAIGEKAIVYGVVGYERGEFTATSGGTEVDFETDAIRYGVGAESFVRDGVSLRSELNYVDWNEADEADLPAELRGTIGLAVHF